jgi:hypothetical protein
MVTVITQDPPVKTVIAPDEASTEQAEDEVEYETAPEPEPPVYEAVIESPLA